MNDNPLIIALDVDTIEEARRLVGTIGDERPGYKVGMELYAVTGMAFVPELLSSGRRVFLDLKLYNISEFEALRPSTMA